MPRRKRRGAHPAGESSEEEESEEEVPEVEEDSDDEHGDLFNPADPADLLELDREEEEDEEEGDSIAVPEVEGMEDILAAQPGGPGQPGAGGLDEEMEDMLGLQPQVAAAPEQQQLPEDLEPGPPADGPGGQNNLNLRESKRLCEEGIRDVARRVFGIWGSRQPKSFGSREVAVPRPAALAQENVPALEDAPPVQQIADGQVADVEMGDGEAEGGDIEVADAGGAVAVPAVAAAPVAVQAVPVDARSSALQRLDEEAERYKKNIEAIVEFAQVLDKFGHLVKVDQQSERHAQKIHEEKLWHRRRTREDAKSSGVSTSKHTAGQTTFMAGTVQVVVHVKPQGSSPSDVLVGSGVRVGPTHRKLGVPQSSLPCVRSRRSCILVTPLETLPNNCCTLPTRAHP
jgi:hypothetical protein